MLLTSCTAQSFGSSQNIVNSVKCSVFTTLGCSCLSYVECPYFRPLCVCVVRYISLCKHWCGHYIPQWGLCFITLTGWTRMFMCGQWVSCLVFGGGKQGHRSASPWLDLDTDLVMCNEGYIDIGGLHGLSVVYPWLILFSEVSLVSQWRSFSFLPQSILNSVDPYLRVRKVIKR